MLESTSSVQKDDKSWLLCCCKTPGMTDYAAAAKRKTCVVHAEDMLDTANIRPQPFLALEC